MTTSSDPQSNTKPASMSEFQKKFAERTAEKIIRNQEKVARRAETFQDRMKRPASEAEIKAFFAKKREQEAKLTPEEKQKKINAFFQRKADQKAREEKAHFDTLKAQPAYQGVSDERLFKLAEMRNAYSKENMKANLSDQAMDKAMANFDKNFANPKKLDAVMSAAQEKAAELKETRTPSRDEGMSR